MSKNTYIPQYLLEPTRYIFFTADEFAAILLPTAIVGIFGSILGGMAAGAASLWCLRKLKSGGPLSRVIWRMYWLFPPNVSRTKATPPSHLRYLAG